MIQIDQRMIKACLLVTPKDDIRFYLNGIKIEATKTHTAAIATDGHRLFAIRQACVNEIDEDVCFILPRAIAQTMAKEKSKTTIFKTKPEDKISVRLADGEMEFIPIPGKFPDWVKPCAVKPSPQTDICINGKYLGDFGEIAKILTGLPNIMLSSNESQSGGVLVSFCKSEFEAAAICMPVRNDNDFYPRNRMPSA